MALDDEKIAELIANALTEHKKEKSWFMKLGWVYKTLLAFISFCVAVTTLGGGIGWFFNLVFQEEIMEYEDLKKKVNDQPITDSLLIEAITKNTEARNKAEGSKLYAVGYRAEELEDGTIIKYYRGWDGKMHKIIPDLSYSTSTFTYWIFHNEDGTKEFTFGK
jgi:hypothetical protein